MRHNYSGLRDSSGSQDRPVGRTSIGKPWARTCIPRKENHMEKTGGNQMETWIV